MVAIDFQNSRRTIAMFCFSPPDTPPFLLPSIAAAPFSAAAIILSNPNMASIRFSLSASKSSESSVRLSRIVPPPNNRGLLLRNANSAPPQCVSVDATL